MADFLSRRTLLAALGSGLAAGLAASPGVAGARRTAAPHGGIHVDVGPLRATGAQTIADWVERSLPGALAESFAARGLSGEPVSATVDLALLGPQTGGPSGASPDQIVGSVTVGGVTRPLRATTWYYPSAFDIPNLEASNFSRIQDLCAAFARWAAQGAA